MDENDLELFMDYSAIDVENDENMIESMATNTSGRECEKSMVGGRYSDTVSVGVFISNCV